MTHVRRAAGWIRSRLTEPLRIKEIADAAHMSAASLHRHFKSATGMSPMQFQKRLRLYEARRLLVAGHSTASAAADAVGHTSATQFNREYRRAFGTSPGRDAARLRRVSEPADSP
ncbi:AraC family transcriptional regulator [Streptomyces sp. NPDC002133]|uniref:AraC family transcriptional regulator n=1 Tax=Streptomyces sp. NPDC002133 TaxID=3154409 RepID=UPI003319687E